MDFLKPNFNETQDFNGERHLSYDKACKDKWKKF
jgi:hypothetical protein